MGGQFQSETVVPHFPSSPSHRLPVGACDTHTHVFGPYDRFPFVHPSSYAPPLAPVDVHAQMLRRIGATRSVVVQPAPYADDPSALLDVLRQARGQARGIAVCSHDIADRTLRAWHDAGVRGLRFSEVLDAGTGKRFAGSVAVSELPRLALRMKGLGWHAQVWAPCRDVDSIVRTYGALGVPLVFEHLGMVVVQEGLNAPAFEQILALVRDGRIWVKLDVCRVSKMAPNYEDLRPFHDALLRANRSQLLWASDWPFVRLGELAPDVGDLVDLFYEWAPDQEIRHRILVENPQRLYQFENLASL